VDLELLRTFLEVERLRHFGHAGEALHLTQAAISARIKLLESTLGVRLLDRDRNEIRLTPEGARLMRHAERLLSGWRQARQDVSSGGADLQLSIGGSLRLWDPLLQEWLHRLRLWRPELALIAESHTPEVLTRRILDGVLDVAFMLEPAQFDVLQIVPVRDIILTLVSTKPDEILSDALGDGYIMVDWGLAHALHYRRLFPDAPEPRLRVGQSKMALTYMEALGGSAYVPVRMCRAAIEGGDMYIVEHAPTIERTAYAVYMVRSAREEMILSTLELFSDEDPVNQR
jgi:DNA-binding transcriptional LysR family regulator